MDKTKLKKAVSFVGSVLMVVSLGFIAHRLYTFGIDFSLLAVPAVVGGLLAIAAAEGLALLGASFNFRSLVRNTSGITVEKPLAASVYLVSNLYKYIPGSVLYVAGRHRIAVETDGLTHAKVAFSTVVEGILYVVGALSVAFIFAFESSAYLFAGEAGILPVILLVLGLVIVIAAVPVYLHRERIKAAVTRFWATVEIFNFWVFAKRFGFSLLLMFLWGLTFLFTLMLLGQPMTGTLPQTIIGLYLLAWLAGFLVPGAPSGLGVREAVMLMFLGGLVYEDILLAAMVLHRVITVAGDLFAYALAIGYKRYSLAKGDANA